MLGQPHPHPPHSPPAPLQKAQADDLHTPLGRRLALIPRHQVPTPVPASSSFQVFRDLPSHRLHQGRGTAPGPAEQGMAEGDLATAQDRAGADGVDEVEVGEAVVRGGAGRWAGVGLWMDGCGGTERSEGTFRVGGG